MADGSDLAGAIRSQAAQLGVDPLDVATAISYETGGTFDPWQKGPTTKWGTHRGLIQFGEPQQQQFGVYQGQSAADQMASVASYLRSTGVKPGMGLLDIYSAINAGGVGRYNASDAGAGGAPGTVRDKVEQQMDGHRQNAARLLGVGPYDFAAAVRPGMGDRAMNAVSQPPAAPAAAIPARRTVGDVMTDALPAFAGPSSGSASPVAAQTAAVSASQQARKADPGILGAPVSAPLRGRVGQAPTDPDNPLFAGLKPLGTTIFGNLGAAGLA